MPSGEMSTSPEMTTSTQTTLPDPVKAAEEPGFDNLAQTDGLPAQKERAFEQMGAPAPRGMGHGGMTSHANRQAEAECVDCCGECCSGVCTLGCAVGVAACCDSCDCACF